MADAQTRFRSSGAVGGPAQVPERDRHVVSGSAERFVVLDSWRGLAALAIVFLHIRGDYWWAQGVLHSRLNLAVDFFFVLSGFVIAAAYGERLRAGFGTARFMFLRYMRLLPLHVFVVGLLVLLELGFAATGAFSELAGREPFSERRELWTLPATMSLLQEYVHPGVRPWNAASWSISIEIGLYLMAALLLRFFGKAGTAIALVIALAAIIALPMAQDRGVADILRGLAGFGTGMALYEVWQRMRHLELSRIAATVAEVAVVVTLVLAVINMPFGFLPSRGVADMIFAVLILIFAFQRGALSQLLLRPAFVWLGTLSYSVYMVHSFVIGRAFDTLALLQWRTGWELVEKRPGMHVLVLPEPLGILAAIAMIAGSILFAYFTWRFIEEPGRLWSKRKAEEWDARKQEKRAPWK